jgi:hypothetical protein
MKAIIKLITAIALVAALSIFQSCSYWQGPRIHLEKTMVIHEYKMEKRNMTIYKTQYFMCASSGGEMIDEVYDTLYHYETRVKNPESLWNL